MKPNRDNEKFFLNLVRNGIITVSSDGIVYNNVTKRQIGYTTKRGYRALGWKENRKVRHILTHRLVYLLFGSQELGDKQVNHRNGVKNFNTVSNLEPATNSENTTHAYKTGLSVTTPARRAAIRRLCDHQYGQNNPRSKLTNEDVRFIRVSLLPRKFLAQKFGVSRRTIDDVVNGKSYRESLTRPVFRFSAEWYRRRLTGAQTFANIDTLWV